MEKQDLKERVSTNLRSVTQSCKGGVPLTRLNRDYQDLLGSPIPFKELGFTSLESFIKSIPNVIYLRERQGQIFAEGVADNTTAHIVSLVSRQKQTKTTAKPGRKPYKRGGFASRSRGSRNTYPTTPRTSFQPSGKAKFPAQNHSKPPQPAYIASNSTSNKYSSKAPSKKFDLPPRFQKLQQQRESENNRGPSPPVNYPPSRSPTETYPRSTSPRTSPEFFYSSRSSPVPFIPKPTKSLTRTIPGPAASQQSFDDFHYPQRNLRPLRPKNDDRVEKLKRLENIEDPKEYIDMYAEINNLSVEYLNLSIGQKKKNKGFTSVLKLGEKRYQSYPHVAKSEAEAEDIAARKAVESIQESKDFLTALPETPIRTMEEVQTLIKNIEEIVCEKPTGMFSHGISSEYESKFEESLPNGWIEKVKDSSNFDVEQVEVPYGRVPDGVSYIIRPARNYSSGSTTPSEVSASHGIAIANGDLAMHKFEHKPLPKVPELVVPDGNEWGVFITYASSYIAARLVDYDEDFVNFSKSMYEFYGSHSLSVSEIFERHLYAFVRDAGDEKVVHRVLANKTQDNMVECYFVDEGYYDQVNKSYLHDLHNDFFKFPYQAVHLVLDGLESYEQFMKPADLEIVQEKTLIAVVKRFRYTEEDIFPDVQGIHKRVFSVVLYDTSDEDNDICLNDHFKHTVLESWECKLPKEGTLNKGYLTHVTEFGEIFIRFQHPINSFLEIELDKLSMEFEEACLEFPPVSPNEIFVAKFGDGRWYRAVLPEQSSVHPDPEKITVFFIDYGHPSDVYKSEVCPLLQFSEFLASLGKQAIQCELHNVLPSPKYQWSDAASMKLMQEAPIDEEVIVRVIVEGNDFCLPKVSLHKRSDSDPNSPIISINEKLSSQPDLFQSLSDASHVSAALNVPNNLTLLHKNTELLYDSYSSNKVGNTVTHGGVDLNKITDGIEWLTTPDVIKSPDAFDVISPSPLSPPEVPNKGEMFDVFVTIAATPHNFIVQPLKCAGAMNELRLQMQQFYTTEENLLEMDLSMLRKNCFYAALHPDGEWYRVRVVSITENDPIMAAVYYVDFGDFGTVGIQSLQLLSQRFRNLPCQAIKASLSGIKPIIGNDWNPVHCVKFKEMVTEKNFVSVVKSKFLRDEQDFCCLELEVILIDTSDPEKDVYINEKLVEMSMAQPV